MKAARGADGDDGGAGAALAQAAYEAADDRVECQFCGRKFNDTAAQRHIPSCEQKTKASQMKGKAPPSKM
jgi:hypothetical protein